MARRDSFGIAAQTAWGTANATPDYYIPVTSVTVSPNEETIEVEETTGTRFPSRIEKGTRYSELSVEGPVRVESFGSILYAALGEPTTTNNDPAYIHEFDPAAASKVPLPVSMRVSRVDPDTPIVDQFEDAIVNTLSVSCEPNGYASYTASFVAKDYESAATPSPTLDFSDRFPFHQLTAYISVNGGSETEIPLASWSVEYNNNIPTDAFVLGQRTLWEVVEDNADCSVTFSPRSDLNDHYRRALADSPDAVKLRLEATGDVIGSAAGNVRFEVTLHLLEYTDAPANISASDRLNMIEVSGRAAYDDANSKFVTFELENEVASYAQPT